MKIKLSVFEYDVIKSALFSRLKEEKEEIVKKAIRNILKQMVGIKAEN